MRRISATGIAVRRHVKIFVLESIASCVVELFHERVIIAVLRFCDGTEAPVAIRFFVNTRATNFNHPSS